MRGVIVICETDCYAICADGTQYDTSCFDIKDIKYFIKMLYLIIKSDATEISLSVFQYFDIKYSIFIRYQDIAYNVLSIHCVVTCPAN